MIRLMSLFPIKSFRVYLSDDSGFTCSFNLRSLPPESLDEALWTHVFEENSPMVNQSMDSDF